MTFRTSLRSRLALGTSVVIAALVGAFALAIMAGVSAHVLGISHAQARASALDLRSDLFPRGSLRPDPRPLRALRATANPQAWLLYGRRVLLRSPNAPPRVPPVVGPVGPILGLGVYRITLPAGPGDTLVLDWPLAADLDLLRDLALVLILGGFATVAAGTLVARWATRRVLEPVDRMTGVARHALETGEPFLAPPTVGESDEFTALGEILERLTQKLTLAREADRRLLADAAHELRTPLAILDGNLNLIRDWGGQDPEVRTESLRVMERTLGRLTRLVHDLLVLVRAEAEVDRTVPRAGLRTDLADLATELCEDTAALAAGLTLEADVPPDPLWAAGDPHAVREAAWALLENATQYTPAGGRITVRVRPIPTEGRVPWVEFVVDDSGPGIAPEERERVFDRFYRGTSGRSRPEGTGLGLAVARALVQAQGGTLRLESSPEGGTRARIRLVRLSAVPPTAEPR